MESHLLRLVPLDHLEYRQKRKHQPKGSLL
jgi:hypothetical protein